MKITATRSATTAAVGLACAAASAFAATPASAAPADAVPTHTITVTVSTVGSAQTIISAEGYYQNQLRRGTFSRTFEYKQFAMYQAAVASIDGSGIWCRIAVGDQVVQEQRADGPFATVACTYSPFTPYGRRSRR